MQVLRHQRGIPELTTRQWELLHLVEAGFSNTQIARRLHIAESTVRKHLENTFRRLDVSSRTAAVAAAFPQRAHPLTD
jgi:DNA-binding NarL/FixJ family response regulator